MVESREACNLLVCGEKGCIVENNLSATKLRGGFWTFSRLESEDWVHLHLCESESSIYLLPTNLHRGYLIWWGWFQISSSFFEMTKQLIIEKKLCQYLCENWPGGGHLFYLHVWREKFYLQTWQIHISSLFFFYLTCNKHYSF